MTEQVALRLEGESDRDGVARALASYLDEHHPIRSKRLRIMIQLSTPPVQRRLLRDVPPMRRAVLREFITYQSGKYFRSSPGGLTTDAAWVRTDGEPLVGAVAVETSIVTALAEAAAQAGMTLIDIVPAPEVIRAKLSLLPSQERERRVQIAWRTTRRTAFISAALVLGVGAFSWHQRAAARSTTMVELEKLRRPAQEVRRARAVMDSAITMLVTVQQARSAAHGVISSLASIAGQLPDSTVITALTVDRDGGGQLEGLGREPLKVLARLKRLEEFQTAKLDASPVLEASGGRSWFRFGISLRPKADP